MTDYTGLVVMLLINKILWLYIFCESQLRAGCIIVLLANNYVTNICHYFHLLCSSIFLVNVFFFYLIFLLSLFPFSSVMEMHNHRDKLLFANTVYMCDCLVSSVPLYLLKSKHIQESSGCQLMLLISTDKIKEFMP